MDVATTQHIAISPEVAGGRPRIAGHRITVQNVVIWIDEAIMADESYAAELRNRIPSKLSKKISG